MVEKCFCHLSSFPFHFIFFISFSLSLDRTYKFKQIPCVFCGKGVNGVCDQSRIRIGETETRIRVKRNWLGSAPESMGEWRLRKRSNDLQFCFGFHNSNRFHLGMPKFQWTKSITAFKVFFSFTV